MQGQHCKRRVTRGQRARRRMALRLASQPLLDRYLVKVLAGRVYQHFAAQLDGPLRQWLTGRLELVALDDPRRLPGEQLGHDQVGIGYHSGSHMPEVLSRAAVPRLRHRLWPCR